MDSILKQNSDTDLCFLFGWFDNQLKNAVLKAAEAFWENKFEIKTQSLTTNFSVKDDITSKGEIYFTTELPVCSAQNAFIRLSSDFIRILLHDTFGSNSPVFKLQELSELEIKILNSFCEFINDEIKNFIIPHDKIPKKELKNKGMYNAAFLLSKEDKTGKIVISFPQNCIAAEKIQREENFSYEDFLNAQTFVNISAGTSRISLNDLKNLYPGDILLLENSNVNLMEIKTGNIKKSFKVNPEPALMLELDEDEHELGADMSDNQNIWDDIQIEVGAEFDKVKMSIGDLKQISKGLVIDLGPVFNNKISLLVENKVVARGELVILNDKYGVKVDEIISSGQKENSAQAPGQAVKPQAQPQKPAAHQAQAQPQANPEQVNKMAQAPAENAQAGQQGDVEEFDYSDFENEEG